MDKEFICKELEKGCSRSLADFLRSDREKIIYGMGNQSFICCDICNRLGNMVKFFMTARSSSRMPLLSKEIDWYQVNNFPFDKDDYDVLIAVNEKYNDSIKTLLQQNGFNHIYYSDAWGETNREYRYAFLRHYLKNEVNADLELIDITKCKLFEYGNFRILGCENMPEEYTSMLTGDFYDIIAPSIFYDSRYCREGGYEDGEEKIEEGDIVLDLGANIGMFSCVAAAKGERVYAFEPTPNTVKLLEKNAALYNNFYVEPYAVSDYVGTCKFSVNDVTEENANTGGNTMYAERLGEFDHISQVEVNVTTIDEFVKRQGLEHVDFIKADIEGSERHMLEGAKETLRKFEPKLSLCTYHLPDDPGVMKELILKYNPRYVIRQETHKMYAYVPR